MLTQHGFQTWHPSIVGSTTATCAPLTSRKAARACVLQSTVDFLLVGTTLVNDTVYCMSVRMQYCRHQGFLYGYTIRLRQRFAQPYEQQPLMNVMSVASCVA